LRPFDAFLDRFVRIFAVVIVICAATSICGGLLIIAIGGR